MNLVQVSVEKQITAATLQDTDGSASHPYQFFGKDASAPGVKVFRRI